MTRNKTKKPLFTEIDAQEVRGSIIILDIDGTIVPDGEHDVHDEVRIHIELLSQNNHIFLCSNKAAPIRNEKIKNELQLKSVSGIYRKPDSRIKNLVIEQLDAEDIEKPFIVIGDKSMVDGVFARRIGARFIQVDRLKSQSDSLLVRISYLIDSIYAVFFDKNK